MDGWIPIPNPVGIIWIWFHLILEKDCKESRRPQSKNGHWWFKAWYFWQNQNTWLCHDDYQLLIHCLFFIHLLDCFAQVIEGSEFPIGTLRCTEVHFANFFFGGFITAIAVNPPERKLVKRTTSVRCMALMILKLC